VYIIQANLGMPMISEDCPLLSVYLPVRKLAGDAVLGSSPHQVGKQQMIATESQRTQRF